MRERTPSADDTPKRAPPAPPREAASADIAGSKTSNGAVEVFRTAKLSPTTTASLSTTTTVSTTATATTTSSTTSTDNRMVASTHNLDDLSVSHPASASTDRQQQQQLQEKHGHTYRSAQTAQDKRSRLSNVINNLRKKVPDTRTADSPRKEEDDRNSVERNLETLEKYVMTVLNGVIKDEEDDDREIGRKNDVDRPEKNKETEKMTEDQEDEDSKGPAAKFEPSKPNESRTEAAVLLIEQPEKVDNALGYDTAKECRFDCERQGRTDGDSKNDEESNCSVTSRMNESELERSLANHDSSNKELDPGKVEAVESADEMVSSNNKGSSKETKPEEYTLQEMMRLENQDVLDEKKESRSLGTIIMERLIDHHTEDRINSENSKDDHRKFIPENIELRNICRDLLNDLLNGINQLIDENGQEAEDARDQKTNQEFSMTSLHCSLPLDKVASVLQNCQTNEVVPPQSPSSSSSSSHSSAKSPTKPPSPTVRHLCLYCDRKFLSISLRQRHTERVHQLGGGRRSERNSRKPSQNCQYCSDKCAESLEGLFQHMVASHGDKYHACVQCSTRYLTREALVGHMNENHSTNGERTSQVQEKVKEPSPCKELNNQSPREKAEPQSPKERKPEEMDSEHRTESMLLKPIVSSAKDSFSNPGSPEFDSSFYSSVSCNIRENLLHHLDGKLQTTSSPTTSAASTIVESKQPPQQQSFYEHSVNQIQFPIDISLTAATPVYTKDYTAEEYENSSEYAQKPGKSRSHPRRVSFEKYNFPRKYDGKEQWTCSIKDLSKFDISTQLSLRKKQQLLKERITLNRLHQMPILVPSGTTEIVQNDLSCKDDLGSQTPDESKSIEEVPALRVSTETLVEQTLPCDTKSPSTECKTEADSFLGQLKSLKSPEFSAEFGHFLRLRKWDENTSSEPRKTQEVVYAELTGEWSRPRIYICGACASKHVTLKEMEDHKASTHPNVWCSHFEFSGDQRELYKHLFLPGRSVPTAKARNAILTEKVCTKCSKNCTTLPELHRHMLECGGDQAWLLGLFGNGKKKCKWRPFGSRSRRRRQRGMKRNIQNSQTPRVNVPKEKQPTGPRVRPSDRESIQKMLANLPPKRATRKVLQDSTLRAQGRLRNVQTRSRPRIVGDNSTASRMSRNKAVLRNKLLKNAKSIQRNRCRSDNISAIIESVVRNYNGDERKLETDRNDSEKSNAERDAKEKSETNTKDRIEVDDRTSRTKIPRGPRVLGKKRNVKTRDVTMKSVQQTKRERMGNFKAKTKISTKNTSDARTDYNEGPKVSQRFKLLSKATEKEVHSAKSMTSPSETKSSGVTLKNKSPTQTTPRRKRPVDPVASLNASIKAKSQLRTQDGKFARNPNKDSSPQKSPETRPSNVGRQAMKIRSNNSPESSVMRSKLRTVSRTRNSDVQLPKRTRLSSDSDKMPTLEPAVQISSNEDYVDTSTNDLPILSPVGPSASNVEQKSLRGKNPSNSKNSSDKEGVRKSLSEVESVDKKNETINVASSQEGEKEQKGKGRRARNDAKSVEMDFENIQDQVDVPKEGGRTGVKEGRLKNRKSIAGKLGDDNRKEEKKTVDNKNVEEPLKKEGKQKKEEGATKTFETRSNSRAKLEKALDTVDDTIKIQSVPFEVKKLIGSDSKEDLLTKLNLSSREASSKRSLRQSVPRSKAVTIRGRVQRDVESEKTIGFDLGVADVKVSRKEKMFDARRKSPRNMEKKVETRPMGKDDKLVNEETNKVQDLPTEAKTVIRGRRSNSVSNENKTGAVIPNPILSPGRTKGEVQDKTEVETVAQNVGNENVNNKRQTRGSLLNSTDGETQNKEASNELNDTSLKKNTSLGKRRGRIKSSNEGLEKKPSSEDSKKDEIEDRGEVIEKKDVSDENETNLDKTVTLDDSLIKEDEDEADVHKGNFNKRDSCQQDTTEVVNQSLTQLQLETGSSIDSGKENSLETSVTVQKLKVGRPRKSWGSRRERTSKRSLSNVIGILTEGMNIPVEVQQSVVLTVQTTLDNVNPDGGHQNARQPDESNSAARSLSLDRTDKPSENDVLEVTSDPERANEEARSCSQKSEEEEKPLDSSEASLKDFNLDDSLTKEEKTEACPNASNKEQTPANDIILDLSRRKQKGKGSFLEKIVSKIAKQKDALLEGEVGSLLDTAADELTSILDEVGPTFAESAENVSDLKHPSRLKHDSKNKISPGVGKIREASDKSSATSKLPESNVESKCLKNPTSNETEKIKPENGTSSHTAGSEVLEGLNEIQEKSMSNQTSNQSMETQSDSMPVQNQNKDNETSMDVQKESSTDASMSEAPSVDTYPIPNGIRPPQTISDASNTSEVCPSKETEGLTKMDEDMEGTKPKRKSKKRSLEANSPKKNKRKSIEATEASEENLLSEELHLADIMKLIDKSKPVPFANDDSAETMTENGSLYTDVDNERVQPGKRKTINDSEIKDVTSNKINIENVHRNDPNDVREKTVDVKKLKTDNAVGVEDLGFPNEEKELVPIESLNTNDITELDRKCTENSSALRTGSKRKTFVENAEQYPDIDSQVRRCSKRRPLPEEKSNQSHKVLSINESITDSKDSSASEPLDTSRRRSSRTKLINESKNNEERLDVNFSINKSLLESTSATEESLCLNKSMEICESPERTIPTIQATILRIPEVPKIFERDLSSSYEKMPVEDSTMADLNEPKKFVNIVVPKVPKKRGRKKKCLINEDVRLTDVCLEDASEMEIESGEAESIRVNELAGKEPGRTEGINEVEEEKDKVADSQVMSPSLENFKIPEVTEVLQHTKKRTSKRKSMADEHLDGQSIASVDCDVNKTEYSSNKSSVEKELGEQLEKASEKESSSEFQKRVARRSTRDQSEKLERSNSSSSIDLVQSTRTRSSKRKQHSSDDLAGQMVLNQRAESVENLSEASCASESSYFRKKRFTRKKKGFQEPPEDVQTDTSVTDSESVEAEKSLDRRQSLKRRAKNNISFIDDPFILFDGFDASIDIPDCLQTLQANESLENIGFELKSKSPIASEKSIEADSIDANKEIEKNEAITEQSTVTDLDEESDRPKDGDPRQTDEEFQTPKKRAAGNFVVVHKKTGEILIVEKRKKLTKEAARFFCDVCATSFTRKSSLKKHNLSQSHLLQLAKSVKEKGSMDCNESINLENPDELCDDSWKNEGSNDDRKILTNETTRLSRESESDSSQIIGESLQSLENDTSSRYSVSMESGSLIDPRVTRQDVLEDELLDEEICKITENMSHDEYVLTDHVSPIQPESSSTPIKIEVKKKEDIVKKKKEKGKKKNLADEHLALDTPEPDDLVDSSVSDAIVSSTSKCFETNLEEVLEQPMENGRERTNMEATIDLSKGKNDFCKEYSEISNDLRTSENLVIPDEASASRNQLGVNDAVVDREKVQGLQAEYSDEVCAFERIHERGNENFAKGISDSKHVEGESRVSLKFTISKCNLEYPKEFNIKSSASFEFNRSNNLEYVKLKKSDEARDAESGKNEGSLSEKCNMQVEPSEELDRMSVEDDQADAEVRSETPVFEKESSVEKIEYLGNFNVSKEDLDGRFMGRTNLEEVGHERRESILVDEEADEEQRPAGLKESDDESNTGQHVKSKKGKGKKNTEEADDRESSKLEDRNARKSAKVKRQSKQVLEESVECLESDNQSERVDDISINKCEDENMQDVELSNSELIEGSNVDTSNLVNCAGLSTESEVREREQNFCHKLETEKEIPEEIASKVVLEQQEEKIDGEVNKNGIELKNYQESTVDCGKKEAFLPIEDDEISSSSSLTDRPLLDLITTVGEKLERSKEEDRVALNFPNPSVKSRLEKRILVDDILSTDSKVMELDSDENSLQDNSKLIDNRQSESQVVSEEESVESVKTKPVEEDKVEEKVSSESESNEVVQEIENNQEGKGLYDVAPKVTVNLRKSNTVDRSNSSKKITKGHKSVSKESHRRSKAPRAKSKKGSLRTKINDLTSESDDSDSENKIESQNKSKIVKCVFGRVFGSEKTDKVKEVLNDWVSKSEDDSDISRTGFRSGTPSEGYSCHKGRESSDVKGEDKNRKRHSASSAMSSSLKKRPGRKPKANLSSDQVEEKNTASEDQEDHHSSNKLVKSKSSLSNRRKHESEEANNLVSGDASELILPNSRRRESKKIAEERISRAFEDEVPWKNFKKSSKHKETNYGLRNQPKPELINKDNGYGSFNYDEEPGKEVNLHDDPILEQEEQKLGKRRKSTSSKKSKRYNEEDWKDLIIEKRPQGKNTEELDDDGDSLAVKSYPQEEELRNQMSVDLESSRSYSSLARSSVRNRSPSLDRNSQTTGGSNVYDEDDHEDEDIGQGRISPLFICGTPGSSIESSCNSENEEEDEDVRNEETVSRRRSSSEFSGEKIVIRSPSSHKTEVVTIAPTDAIEDNALDVPQEIEATKPRQGKVLNFDEELFVECCSRLKATTENELRGAKKIKLDHIEGYHRKDDQQQGFRGTRDRWRDVESQNSLGSLLESVNQLLGEEMYSTRERDYPKRSGRNLRSEHSSRSASPDMSRADNLGYEDSLDVAFEHNNKLRDKIQQRMRESENLIATTFGQKTGTEINNRDRGKDSEEEALKNSYARLQDQGQLSGPAMSNGVYNDAIHVRTLQEQSNKVQLDSSGFKSKMNSSLGGLLDKALSNLLHSNGKHDHNGSTPMKVLAELACARAPTSTSTAESSTQEDVQPAKISTGKDPIHDSNPVTLPKDLQKKTRNTIKELFERKKEMNERKQQEKSKAEAALRELNVHRQRKTKKTKKRQEFPLIRRNEYGGLPEKKKRREGLERKEELASGRIKDVYEFDEEESQMEPNLGSVMSYRSRADKGYEVSCLRTKEVDVDDLMTKAIGDTLENGKTGDALGTRLESMIDRKFKELEKFAPKTKGALKAFQSEEQQRHVTGPMDEFVERKQQRSKRLVEQSLKHSKLKRRSKNPRKKTRNAWYENDSSDEYRTAVKTEDVGVGISKSQRTCSKGKQNLFAELSSSGSEYDNVDDFSYETKRQRRVKKGTKKVPEVEDVNQSQESSDKVFLLETEERIEEWIDPDLKNDCNKNDCDNKKSESEMSDHPLVIDERKDMDEQRNSDEETENQYERNFELDDLYREDSSVAESEVEDPAMVEGKNKMIESGAKSPSLPRDKVDEKAHYMQEDELIPLEEALDLLDQPDTNLGTTYETVNNDTKGTEHMNKVASVTSENETFDQVEESPQKDLISLEEQEDEQDDDLLALPEKLSSNEKPQKESENLPLHVFLSRKVQESKKRKEQQLKKMQEEQERILMDFQPTRRQRKCAIGKQGLLAEISSSDEETCVKDNRKTSEKSDNERPRKQKRESKEKRKERYIEKKHEQMIAKEQKAIEEEILRELGKKKETCPQNNVDKNESFDNTNEQEGADVIEKAVQVQKKKPQSKEKQKKPNKVEESAQVKSSSENFSDSDNDCKKSTQDVSSENHEAENNQESCGKQKKRLKSPAKPKRASKVDTKAAITGRKNRNSNGERSKNRTDSKGSKEKERRSSSSKRDSDDEELKTTKSWNKVEEGVGVAIGRRKRAAANQLYYWSSSSDEEEMLEVVPAVEEEEDDRQEQHGWIVGDSHKRMITMLAMEKQLKEKRRRSEDEFEPGKAKSKKHRNSTS